MTSIAVFLILTGVVIFSFSFVINAKSFDKYIDDFQENIYDNIVDDNFFETEKENNTIKESSINIDKKNIDNLNQDTDNICENNINQISENSDDEDFRTLMRQSKFLVRIIGIILFTTGIGIYIAFKFYY